jgi:hypothetical protein
MLSLTYPLHPSERPDPGAPDMPLWRVNFVEPEGWNYEEVRARDPQHAVELLKPLRYAGWASPDNVDLVTP